jgi:hypothetical protein
MSMRMTLPPLVGLISRISHRLLTVGVPMSSVTLLRSRGGRTGRWRTIPVVILRHEGREWLVSPFRDTNWVRNIRHDNRAEIGRGRRFRAVRLVETDDPRKLEILRRYRTRYRFVPFVRAAFDATPADSVAMFQREAHRHPTFRVSSVRLLISGWSQASQRSR